MRKLLLDHMSSIPSQWFITYRENLPEDFLFELAMRMLDVRKRKENTSDNIERMLSGKNEYYDSSGVDVH